MSYGGAGEDRTRDLLTASFQLNIEPIEDKGLRAAQSGIERQERRNFRNPGATKMLPSKQEAEGGCDPQNLGQSYGTQHTSVQAPKKIVPAPHMPESTNPTS
jgi:hypothetical protein